MRKILIFMVCLLAAFMTVGSVASCQSQDGSEIQGRNPVMKSLFSVFVIDNHNGTTENCSGNLVWSNFTFEDNVMGLEPELQMYKGVASSGVYKKNAGGRIKLTFADKEQMSFPVGRDESVKGDMIMSDHGRAFLLLRTYLGAANGSSKCRNMWLVGKSGDKIVVYATKDTLDKAGMVYDDIVPKIHDGKLEIMGIARSYGSGVNGGRGPLGEKYRGKRIRNIDSWYCTANSVYFFWDERAQWFGFQLVE